MVFLCIDIVFKWVLSVAANPSWDTALGVQTPVAARVTGTIYDPPSYSVGRKFDHWYEFFHYRQTIHSSTVFEVKSLQLSFFSLSLSLSLCV